ncbi:MAG: D-2-hydroxyacid dehydrogenase [Ectobacillus sp.]
MNMQNILITGRIQKELQDILEKADVRKNFRFLPEDEVKAEDLQWADGYVGFRPCANFQFGSLKWVHALGAGVDSFLFGRAWDEKVLLTRTVCSFGKKISEYCLSYMLREAQLHMMYGQNQERKIWNPLEPKMLATQKVVIYGTGAIGQEIAKTLAVFGLRPIGVSWSGREKPHFYETVPVAHAPRVLAGAGWIISTLPLTKETERLFNRQFFQLLNEASFINVGRGKTVHEADLLEALEKKHLRLAILDVLAQEPLPEHSPLWNHPQVTITPHISAITSPEEAAACFLETLDNIEQGKRIANEVNIERGY